MNQIDPEMSELPFGPLVHHALKYKVTDERVRMGETALEPFKSATRILTEKSKSTKEIDAATELTAATNSDATLTLTRLTSFELLSPRSRPTTCANQTPYLG